MELKVGNYVLTKSYGLGIVTDLSSSSLVSVSYGRGVERNFLYEKNKRSDVIFYVSSDFIHAMEDDYNYYDYGYSLRNKAIGYANLNKITNFKCLDNEISADIHGTQVYKTKIKFDGTKIDFSCSCPVGGTCKHEYALLSFLNEQINSAKSVFGRKKMKKVMFEQLMNDSTNISRWFDEIVDCVRSFTQEELVDYLSSCEEINEKHIIVLFFLKNKMNKSMDRFYKLISSLQEKCKQDLSLFIDKYYDNYLTRAAFYFSYHYNIAMFFETIISICETNEKGPDILKLIPSLIMCAMHIKKNDYYNKFEFLNAICEYDSSFIVQFFEQDTDALMVLARYVSDFKSLIKCLNTKDFIKLCYAIPSYDFKHIAKEYVRRASSIADSNEYILINSLITRCETLSKNDIKEVIEYIPNNNLVKLLINLNVIVFEDIVLNEEDFHYFDPVFKAGKNIDSYYNYFKEDSYSIHLTLKCAGDKYDICQKMVFGNNISLVYYYNDYPVSKDKNKYVEYLFKRIEELNICSLREKIVEAEEERNKIYLEKQKGIFLDSFNNFTEDYDGLETQEYNSNNLYELKPLFEIEERNEAGEFSLRLKIGNKKFYIIKNIFEFLYNFKVCKTIELGKKENFICNYSNLTPRGQKLLKMIADVYSSTIVRKQSTLIISSNMFFSIIELFKGEYVTIGKDEFLVSLDHINFNIKLDDKYKVKIEPDSYIVYPLVDRLIVIHDNKIDYTFINEMPIKVLSFFTKLNGKDISLVKNEFIDNIYPLVADKIEVGENIKKEIGTKLIEIDSYFDYSDKKIKLQTKYRLNDKIVDLDTIKDKSSLNRIKTYNNLLANLGVDEESKTIKDEEDIFSFFKLDFTNLKKITNVYLSESILNKQIDQFVSPKFKLTYDNEIMSCFYEKSSYSEEDLYQILKAIKHKKKYVLLTNDRIVELDNEDSKMFQEVVEGMDLNPKHLYTEEHEPLYKSLKILNYLDNGDVDEYILNMVNELASFKEAKYKLPKVNADVRKYQVEGFNWMKILEKYSLGGILADDMGLGKSLEIICLLKSNNDNKPSLIVCPKSLIFNWVNEFNKFDEETKVVKIYGTTTQRKDIITSINPNEKVVYITSYDSLRNDIENYDVEFNYLVIDEAQYIKNIEALKTRKVKEIKADHKVALTGTPIENNLLDLWSIFDFIMPKYLDGITSFKSNCQQEEYINLISKKISPFILRRTKKEVLKDLPAKSERIISYEMSPEQRKLYDAICLKAKNELDETGKAFNVLHLLTRLRQICVSPSLFVETYKGTSGKIDGLLSLIKEYIGSGHRILLFSQFVQALDLIENELQKINIEYFKLTGATTAEKRVQYMNEFNANDRVKIFLISLKAGGTGLNLIGADTIIHLDPWWNVASENQASDRAYRIGQTRNVEVIKLILENSIEERVIELQQIKKDLIDKVISDDDSSITNLSKEDIEFLLQ